MLVVWVAWRFRFGLEFAFWLLWFVCGGWVCLWFAWILVVTGCDVVSVRFSILWLCGAVVLRAVLVCVGLVGYTLCV